MSFHGSAKVDSKATKSKARVSSAIVDHAIEQTNNPTDSDFNLETSISRHKRRKEQGKLDPEEMLLLDLPDKGMNSKKIPKITSNRTNLDVPPR